MAKKVLVELLCDLCGDSTNATESRFTVDGVSYEIDLCARHREEFVRRWEPYVAAARTVARATDHSSTRKRRRSADEARAIRSWAAANDIRLSAKGRIPKHVEQAYAEAAGG